MELIGFMDSLQYIGTAYEEGIDDKTKIDRLMEEISGLKIQIQDLQTENDQLRDKLGIPPF
jgi:regulator of replication initiation timing